MTWLGNFVRVNRRRFLPVGVVLLFLLVWQGPAGIIEGLTSFIAAAPMLAVQLAFAMMFMIVQFGALMWFMGRPRKYTITPDDDQVGLTFNDYRGQPDLLDHARSTVNILSGARAFESRGGDLPKGMLLSGLPGTGKTFLASCIASEAKLPFVYVDASSLRGMFWGMDQMMIFSLFRQARGLGRKYAKEGHRGACILFMDEIDAIGAARAGMQQAGGFGGMMMGGGSGSLNTLLNQMDGMASLVEDRWSRKLARWLGLISGPVENKPVIFVIGATNRPEILDAALVRPGRLDRMIKVYPPDGTGRRDIIQHYLSKVAHDPDIPLELMIGDSVQWTPVAIKTTINEALIVAHDDGREMMTYKDWLAAADQRSLGLKQPIANMHPDDVMQLAFHEAGHAVVARYTQPKNRLLKATIIRSGDALGAVTRAPREERYTYHDDDILTDIMVSLGSRAVEEEFLHTKMSGASSDLMHATQRALNYCGRLGMGSTLLVVEKPETMSKMADALLAGLMEETKRLLRERSYVVEAVAHALIERHELIGPELDDVFSAADPKPVMFDRRPFPLPAFQENRDANHEVETAPRESDTQSDAAVSFVTRHREDSQEEGARQTEP